MTDDPLARLRDELVCAADRRNAAAPAPPRRRLRRRGWIALGAVLVAAPAGATAAGIIEFGKGTEAQARVIVVDVLHDTAHLPACKRPGRTQIDLTDAAPLPGITATLPALRRPAADLDPAGVLRRLPTSLAAGPILRRTVRRFRMPGDVEVIAWVQEGEGLGAVTDPAGCDRARRERGAVLTAKRSAPVQQAVAHQLAELFDGAAHAQSFRIFLQTPPRKRFSGAGAGMTVRAGRRLPSGLLVSGSARGVGRMYAGIGRPQTAAVLLRAKRPAQARRVPARITVRDGFYAFVIPRGTGPVDLTEVTATGRVVRVLAVRR